MPPRKAGAEFSMAFRESSLPDLKHARRVIAQPLMSEAEQEKFCAVLESDRGANLTYEQICSECAINYGDFVTTINSLSGVPFRDRINMVREAQAQDINHMILAKAARYLKEADELTMLDIAGAASVAEKIDRLQRKSRSSQPNGYTAPNQTAGFIPAPNKPELPSAAPSPPVLGDEHRPGQIYDIEDGLFESSEGESEGDAGGMAGDPTFDG